MTRRVLAIVGSVIAVIVVLSLLTCGGLGGGGGSVMKVPSASPPVVSSRVSVETDRASGAPTQAVASNSSTILIDPKSGLKFVELVNLPKEASDTMVAIRAGGPFRFSKDGSVFGNRERILPRQPSGYYHEFTVVTPGEATRGARRIVTGGEKYGTVNDEFYYTADHYQTFERIRT